MGPWLIVVGLVGVVIYMASKTTAVATQTQGTTPIDKNQSLPTGGAATISPATAEGSYTASSIYQSEIKTFAPIVTDRTGFTRQSGLKQLTRGTQTYLDSIEARRGANLEAPSAGPTTITPVPPGVVVSTVKPGQPGNFRTNRLFGNKY